MLQKDYAREAWPCEDQLRSGFVEFSGVVVLFVGFMFAGVGESGEKMEDDEQALAVIGKSSRAEPNLPERRDPYHEKSLDWICIS